MGSDPLDGFTNPTVKLLVHKIIIRVIWDIVLVSPVIPHSLTAIRLTVVNGTVVAMRHPDKMMMEIVSRGVMLFIG